MTQDILQQALEAAVPEVIVQKILGIIHNSTEGISKVKVNIIVGQEMQALPQYENTVALPHTLFPLLPQQGQNWYYTGGTYWLLSYDGKIFVETAQIKSGKDPAEDMSPGELWVVTLNDAGTHLDVIQFFPAASGKGVVYGN